MFAFEGECAVHCDHGERGHLAQVGDDVLSDGVTEIFLRRVTAHVIERQDSNCRFFHLFMLRCLCVLSGRSSGSIETDAVNTNWPLDVFQALLAHILESEVEPVTNMITD